MQGNANSSLWFSQHSTQAGQALQALQARTASAPELARLLRESRARTLAIADAYAAALGPLLQVPFAPQFNPPLWELGHLAWFQDYWLARNPQRALGSACDGAALKAASRLAHADALYDSSHVPHASRWHLPLPDVAATRAYAAEVLEATLALLERAEPSEHSDAALYFYRLVLFHEDMHAEAAVYMAQSLGIALDASLSVALYADYKRAADPFSSQMPLQIAAQTWRMGWQGAGFAFDNELQGHTVELPGFEIDSAPVSWQQYLASQPAALPRYVRRADTPSGYEAQRFGQWLPLDLNASAVHISHHEATAWCHWAGRSLPSEAQWECAALAQAGFAWGSVWEWTSSPFTAYPGFVPHPYADYSAPWFHSRRVLKGACNATAPRMAHPRYRNFFTPERNDIFAGFRSCRLLDL